MQVSASATQQRFTLIGCKLFIIANDSVNDVFFELDSDASESGGSVKAGETISFDLGSNGCAAVSSLGILSPAGTSPCRIWWFS